MFDYKILSNQLSYFFSEKYSHLIYSKTDIFEHGFLRLLAYPFIPEKCQFACDDTHLSIVLSAPYEITVSDFIKGLQSCLTGKFSDILLKEIDSNENQCKFCVCLDVPYQLLEVCIAEILESIDLILSDPLKMNFYSYWGVHAKEFSLGLMSSIESLFNEKLLDCPYVDRLDIWSALVKKTADIHKGSSLKILKKDVAADVENFPKITISYQLATVTHPEDQLQIEKKIVLTRNEIVAILSDPQSLDDFLTVDKMQQEFLVPVGIREFIKNNYARKFDIHVNEEGNYVIDLGYFDHGEGEIFKKFDIKALSINFPHPTEENTRYCGYDKENYLKLLLLLKELKGEKCFDERIHQLIYYIRNNRWVKLSKELHFFLSFETETGIEIDYIDVGLYLFDFAKNELKEDTQEKTFSVLFEAFERLIEQNKASVDNRKKIHSVLFEKYLMQINLLSNDDAESLKLREKLFFHSQQAGLYESNFYLAELAGLKFGNTLNNDVTQDLLPVVLELAAENKKTNNRNVCLEERLKKSCEKIACLREELAQLQASRYAHEKFRPS